MRILAGMSRPAVSIPQMKARTLSGHKNAVAAVARGESPFAYLKTYPEQAYASARRGTEKCVRTLRAWGVVESENGVFRLTDIGRGYAQAVGIKI